MILLTIFAINSLSKVQNGEHALEITSHILYLTNYDIIIVNKV